MRFTLLLSTRERFELRVSELDDVARSRGTTESIHETDESARSFAAVQLKDPPLELLHEPVAMVFAGERLIWIGILQQKDIEWRRPVSG